MHISLTGSIFTEKMSIHGIFTGALILVHIFHAMLTAAYIAKATIRRIETR